MRRSARHRRLHGAAPTHGDRTGSARDRCADHCSAKSKACNAAAIAPESITGSLPHRPARSCRCAFGMEGQRQHPARHAHRSRDRRARPDFPASHRAGQRAGRAGRFTCGAEGGIHARIAHPDLLARHSGGDCRGHQARVFRAGSAASHGGSSLNPEDPAQREFLACIQGAVNACTDPALEFSCAAAASSKCSLVMMSNVLLRVECIATTFPSSVS